MTQVAGLERFVAAQEGVFEAARAELAAGRKRGHWMWFVLPQIAGLGRSDMARHYAIADLDEARAYLAHPLLGPRLKLALQALLSQPQDDPVAVLGAIDAQKLRSSATLFEAAGDGETSPRVLERFFAGARCPATLARLAA